jgi:hypothetical protein
MNIKIEKVYERDIDLLMINNFSKGLLIDLFLEKVNKKDFVIDSIEHSLQNQFGESDITVFLSKGKNKIALLIEDKIDAPAMEDQAARYKLRGEKLIDDKIVDEYFVFIIAPQKYLDTNEEAKLYPNKVSYEELLKNVNDEYSKSLLEKALDESKAGYNVIEDKAVTKFWNDLYDYIEELYKNVLKIKINRGAKGSRSFWPTFNTNYKSIKIIYKSNQGNVEIEFPRISSKFNELKKAFISKGIENNEIVVKGDSVVIQKRVPAVNFSDEFDINKDNVDIALQTVIQLEELLESKELYLVYENILKSNI